MTAVFDRTTMALMFEKALRRKKIVVSIVPVPRRYSTSCGLACKFPASLLDDVKVLCAAQKIEVKAFHDD